MTKKTAGKPVIHNVHILDASGSMGGAKYNSAIEGINSEMALLKKDKTVKYTQTIIEFSSPVNTLLAKEHYFMEPMSKCISIDGMGANGGTPLYEVVGNTLEKLALTKGENEAVLVKIFTDGGENSSTGKYINPKELNLMIKLCEKMGFTIAFVGTEFDVDSMVKRVGISKQNSLIHNNSAEDITRAFKMSSESTVSYSNAVAMDGIMSIGNFYNQSDINKDI